MRFACGLLALVNLLPLACALAGVPLFTAPEVEISLPPPPMKHAAIDPNRPLPTEGTITMTQIYRDGGQLSWLVLGLSLNSVVFLFLALRGGRSRSLAPEPDPEP